MSTDTPRTDAQPIPDAGHTLVSRDFARQLERELADMTEERNQWRMSSVCRDKQAENDKLRAILKAVNSHPYIPKSMATMIERMEKEAK